MPMASFNSFGCEEFHVPLKKRISDVRFWKNAAKQFNPCRSVGQAAFQRPWKHDPPDDGVVSFRCPSKPRASPCNFERENPVTFASARAQTQLTEAEVNCQWPFAFLEVPLAARSPDFDQFVCEVPGWQCFGYAAKLPSNSCPVWFPCIGKCCRLSQ